MAIYLSFKEIWRNKGRFFLFSLVIALIALLVLFTAALGEGLASANKEYLEKIDADLLVFQSDTNLSTLESRLDYLKAKRLSRLPEVSSAGAIGFSNVKLISGTNDETTNISFIGVEPGKPGSPFPIEGQNIAETRADTVLIDKRIQEITGAEVGDTITIKSTLGTDFEYYVLTVVGITDGQQYFFQPSIFVSLNTWDKYRPKQSLTQGSSQPVTNVIAIKLTDPSKAEEMKTLLPTLVDDIELADIKTAYESAPGYAAQQGTLNTIKVFTFLIGALVIGGFFQIQTLQKVPQIGMLKAIGLDNPTVAIASLTQIILVSVIGIFIGTLATYLLTIGIPSGVPILLSGDAVMIAIVSLMLIGPIGGMVSVQLAIKIEPLKALGM
ncbi:MAG TPA: ABC transporter permease [Anaerolineales bacterium]|nr:ABC transporter permease [Anaerolineales bacterium]